MIQFLIQLLSLTFWHSILYMNAINHTTCERKVCYYTFMYFWQIIKHMRKKAIDLHLNCAWALICGCVFLFLFSDPTHVQTSERCNYSLPCLYLQVEIIRFHSKINFSIHLGGQKTTSSLEEKSLIPCIHHSDLFQSGDGSQQGLDREPAADMMTNIVVYVV